MKHFILFTLVATASLFGAAPEKSPFPDTFALTPAYRHVVRLDASNLSPFRKPETRALQAATISKPTGPNGPGVLEKFHGLGLTGIIPSTGKRPGTIVLGGNIFREGDEIAVYNTKSRARTPLLAEHRIVLRSVTAQALELSVAHNGDPTPAVKVPITLLEFRQR